MSTFAIFEWMRGDIIMHFHTLKGKVWIEYGWIFGWYYLSNNFTFIEIMRDLRINDKVIDNVNKHSHIFFKQ